MAELIFIFFISSFNNNCIFSNTNIMKKNKKNILLSTYYDGLPISTLLLLVLTLFTSTWEKINNSNYEKPTRNKSIVF